MNSLKLNYSETGTPVVFCFNENLPPVGQGIDPVLGVVANFHHGAQGREKLLAGGRRERALRKCGMQWVTTGDHWDGFHALKLEAELPTAEDASVLYVAMRRARYIGRYGLVFDMKDGKPEVKNRPISRVERKKIWGGRHIVTESKPVVGEYLAEQVVVRGLAAAEEDGKLRALLNKYTDNPTFFDLELLTAFASITSQETGFELEYVNAKKYGLVPDSEPNTPVDLFMKAIMPEIPLDNQYVDIAATTRSILGRAVFAEEWNPEWAKFRELPISA